MVHNTQYLESLRKSAAERNRRFRNNVWMGTALTVGIVAAYFAQNVSSRLIVVGIAVAIVALLHFTEKLQSTAPTKDTPSFRSQEQSGVAGAAAVPNRSATERQATVNATIVGDSTSKSKVNRNREEQTVVENSENFDPLSPSRIAQAVCSDGPVAQPTYTSTAPSLYATTANTYVGKANMANLGFQITGNNSKFNALRSQTTPSTSGGVRGANLGTSTPGASRYQPEPTAPVWHTYHSSPPNVDIGSSPSGSAHRRVTGGAEVEEVDEYDPLQEIVSRVSAEHRGGADFSSSLSRSSGLSGAMAAFGSPARSPRIGRAGMTPGAGRFGSSLGGGGLGEDRLEHVLSKYLESQEQIVAEAAGDILRHLTTRANSTPAPTLSFLAPVQQQQSQQAPSLLQCQDDVTRVQALLHLQTDRQVLQSRRALTLPELLQYCRAISVPEDLLKRYEAAAAVLLTPNRASLSASSPGPSSGSGGFLSPTQSGSSFGGSSLYRTNSGGGAFSPKSTGAYAGASSSSLANTAASFGKGWMSPAPVAEPFASSSGASVGMGLGMGVSSSSTATFTSTRRGRRY